MNKWSFLLPFNKPNKHEYKMQLKEHEKSLFKFFKLSGVKKSG